MIRKIGLFVIVMTVTAGSVFAQNPVLIQGNWQGEFSSADWQSRTLRAQIVGESQSDYRAHIYVGNRDGKEEGGIIKGKTQKNVTEFKGDMDLGQQFGGVYTFDGQIVKGVFTGTLKSKKEEGKASFSLKRVFLKSPTLGQKPPEGAIALMLDQGKSKEEQQTLYSKQKEVFESNWNLDYRWGVMGNGAIRMHPSSIMTKQEYGDGHYHIEFMTPYMPNERGQARGNSGVYLLGRYEVQVLDSFTDQPRDNQCGGIYQQAVPLSNPCLPPGEWQTYDIIFRAPRFDSAGKKTENARITAKLNGKLIHDNLELRHCTPGGVSGKEAPQGMLLFQDHGDYVNWKNVWVKPLN